MCDKKAALVTIADHNMLFRLLNKQDRPNALDEVDATDRLNLAQVVNKNRSPCRVVSTWAKARLSGGIFNFDA